MNIQDVKDRKNQLADKITELIVDFFNVTGCEVKNIKVVKETEFDQDFFSTEIDLEL